MKKKDGKTQVFMEYKILPKYIDKYEVWMKELSAAMQTYGAADFRWFEAEEQPGLYVELFTMPTFLDYEEIKNKRRSKEHPVFGKLDEMIEKPLSSVNCWSFQERTNEIFSE